MTKTVLIFLLFSFSFVVKGQDCDSLTNTVAGLFKSEVIKSLGKPDSSSYYRRNQLKLRHRFKDLGKLYKVPRTWYQKKNRGFKIFVFYYGECKVYTRRRYRFSVTNLYSRVRSRIRFCLNIPMEVG